MPVHQQSSPQNCGHPLYVSLLINLFVAFAVQTALKLASTRTALSIQVMFSCGSLAPKLQRGGGCMDHGFTRQREPWEASDGAVYLLRELAQAASNTVQVGG